VLVCLDPSLFVCAGLIHLKGPRGCQNALPLTFCLRAAVMLQLLEAVTKFAVVRIAITGEPLMEGCRRTADLLSRNLLDTVSTTSAGCTGRGQQHSRQSAGRNAQHIAALRHAPLHHPADIRLHRRMSAGGS